MPHQNSVFRTITQQLDWATFKTICDRHRRVTSRGFSDKSHLLAMLYAQFTGAASLRHVEAGLRSHQARLYHLGAAQPSRTTLADANRDRPAAAFADLFEAMIARAHRGLRRAMDGAVYLIDSTTSSLTRRTAAWARFSDHSCGVKTHVIYDADADCPIYAGVTRSAVNDITAAQAMPIEQGATYVFDLGYYDYAWWAKLLAAQCRIVTRLKSNTPLAVQEIRPVPASQARTSPGRTSPGRTSPGRASSGAAILSDQIGTLPARLARSRRNPVQRPVREVRVRIETGVELRLLTNDLQASADEIAGLYKRRWAIELFFRWVKQTLRITRFLGTSENAVRIQIAVALIAFLLLRMAQRLQRTVTSPLTFARLVAANLMNLRRLDQLDRPPPRPGPVAGQGALALL